MPQIEAVGDATLSAPPIGAMFHPVKEHSERRKIEHAIRRSRAYRARARMRQRRRSIALAAGLSLAVALGSAFSLTSFPGSALADAAVSRARGFLELMAERSPGERTRGELMKSRGGALTGRETAPPGRPLPRNLVEVVAPPAAGLVPVGVEAPAPEIELASILPPGVLLVPPPSGIVFPPGGGGIAPPGGGVIAPPGGGDTPPGSPPGPPDTPPPSAVPEPGTWMLMILGFGLAGWQIRRKRTAVEALR